MRTCGRADREKDNDDWTVKKKIKEIFKKGKQGKEKIESQEGRNRNGPTPVWAGSYSLASAETGRISAASREARLTHTHLDGQALPAGCFH